MEHLQVIGKITDVKIDERNSFITFVTDESVRLGSYVIFTMAVDAINKSNQTFEIVGIEIEDGKLRCKAKEVGYWHIALNRKDNLDIRKLIGLEVLAITDEKTIAGIRESSLWC